MNGSKNWKKIVLPLAVIVLLFVVVFSGLHILESTVFNNEEPPSDTSSSKTVEKEDIEYFPRQDITTVLLIGIDDNGPVQSSGDKINHGFSDVLTLLIFDEKNSVINAIVINRDTMTEMASLDANGRRDGVFYGQIAYSHTFGTGLEDSCENTVMAVSDLLGGVQIDYYASLNMGAVPILNDAVGGVTVNVTDDFSAVDPSITKGEYTLFGNQALTFVQTRKKIGDQLNISRMERHKEYAYGFIEAFRAKTDENAAFVLELLDAVNEYLVTNCAGETVAAMAERYQDYEVGNLVSPKGENILGKSDLGEDQYEFYIDEEDLEKIILEYLYAPK